jgi:hypothetical protein
MGRLYRRPQPAIMLDDIARFDFIAIDFHLTVPLKQSGPRPV